MDWLNLLVHCVGTKQQIQENDEEKVAFTSKARRSV